MDWLLLAILFVVVLVGLLVSTVPSKEPPDYDD